MEERQVDVGGLSTHYLTAGEGPTLVLLHGESSKSWRSVGSWPGTGTAPVPVPWDR